MPKSLTYPLAATAALCLCLSLLAGCGGKERDYGRDLADAAAAAVEAGSAHLQLSGTVRPEAGESGLGLTLQGDAWVDLRTPLAEARLTVLGMELSLRYVEGKAFILLGGNWYELNGGTPEAGEESVSSVIAGLLEALPEALSGAATVTPVGDKKVGNYECDELEVTLDAEAVSGLQAVRDLAASMEISAEELVEYLSESGLVLRVFLQKKEPVIRRVYLAADMGLDFLSELAGGNVLPSILPSRGRVELTVDFPEYGVEVKVEPPAEAKPFKGL